MDKAYNPKAVEGKIYGIFHASTPDTTTPFDLIGYVIEKARGVEDGAKKSISLTNTLKLKDRPL